MTNSKLSKLYLITPEAFNRLSKTPEKKSLHRKINNSKKNIDSLHILKNLQRQKVLSNIIMKNKYDTDNFKNLENILSELTSKIKLNKKLRNDPTSTQAKKLIDFGTQTELINMNNEETQTDWDDDDDEIVEVKNQETQTNRDEANKLTEEEEESLILTPTKTGWPAPFVFSGRKQPKLSKRFASPMIQKLRKIKIADDGKIVSSYSQSPLTQAQAKRRKRIDAIKMMKSSKITGSRKAKQAAMLKMQELLKWKPI